VFECITVTVRNVLILDRVFIMHALPTFLEQITPLEAVEYVLPLLSGLAMDPGGSRDI
jgi:serine/threonine-protein phosphatase 4 regulatory subunit 1